MFNKSSIYAIRSILFLVNYASEEDKMGVAKLSEKLEIPKHFLAKILQRLVKHKLCSSTKGPNGGFYLTQKNKEASILDVVQCLEGTEIFDQCILGLPTCNDDNPCSFHESVKKNRIELRKVLSQETIGSLGEKIKINNYKI